MHEYTIIVADKFDEKFESFLNNLNLINSKQVVKLIKKEHIIAVPKEV